MRGIAALVVVYCHLLSVPLAGEETVVTAFLVFLRDQVFQGGQLGVVLFFIISGYVVPFSMVETKNGSIGKFVISRFMRLYPAYWLSILAGVWLINSDIGAGTILSNLTMAQRFMGFQDILGVYWTLSIELVFYFLVAIAFLAKLIQQPHRLGRLTMVVVAMTLVFAVARRLFDAPLPAGSMIFLCLMFGGAWLRFEDYKNKDLWWIVGAFLLILLAVCWLLYYPDKYGAPWLLQFSRYLYATLIFFAFLNWRAVEARPLVYLGRISYSLYLFHVPVKAAIVWIVETLGLSLGGGGLFTLTLLTAIGVSALTFEYIERPFVRIGKGLQAYYAGRVASQSVR